MSDADVQPDPGLDLHTWESSWASIEEDAEENPDAAVSQFADIVKSMLGARGFDVSDPVARIVDEPELVVTYAAAREVAERAEVGAASRADVEAAIEDLRLVFDSLTAQRP